MAVLSGLSSDYPERIFYANSFQPATVFPLKAGIPFLISIA
jgi:hypothetical protein